MPRYWSVTLCGKVLHEHYAKLSQSAPGDATTLRAVCGDNSWVFFKDIRRGSRRTERKKNHVVTVFDCSGSRWAIAQSVQALELTSVIAGPAPSYSVITTMQDIIISVCCVCLLYARDVKQFQVFCKSYFNVTLPKHYIRGQRHDTATTRIARKSHTFNKLRHRDPVVEASRMIRMSSVIKRKLLCCRPSISRGEPTTLVSKPAVFHR